MLTQQQITDLFSPVESIAGYNYLVFLNSTYRGTLSLEIELELSVVVKHINGMMIVLDEL